MSFVWCLQGHPLPPLSSCSPFAAVPAWMPNSMRLCPWNVTTPTSARPWSACLPRWWPQRTRTPPPPPRTLRATLSEYLPCRCHIYVWSDQLTCLKKHQMLRRGTTEHQPAIIKTDYKINRGWILFFSFSEVDNFIWCQTLHGIKSDVDSCPGRRREPAAPALLSTAKRGDVGNSWSSLLPKIWRRKKATLFLDMLCSCICCLWLKGWKGRCLECILDDLW